ncbi:MAG: type II toxin-antitoxin system RelB/DinJ family antitoxin [Anaerovibrio sp.]|jgi:DNA-damage-inducible protein J|uniref:type II toxin-antitoxin system RelB/DinJ family antitoxin n=1 Tax=Anaerovibrio sp. TaxID=1872532 RepID=UPI001B22026A|nr:type II toxin-antitoxin system RelB/DinJ family antitoxin [Anaerovibrio sp.]MBO6245449.1 type II toxin-antitoxin system RelB/DinJ family antitoxin [Anaerovibrio sp.]
MTTAIVQVRVDNALKKRVESKLKTMGLNMSTAVNMLLHQIDNQNRIPFEISGKESELLQTIKEIEAGQGLSKVYTDPDELYKDLGI